MNRLFKMKNKGEGTWYVVAPYEETAIHYSHKFLKMARHISNISVVEDITANALMSPGSKSIRKILNKDLTCVVKKYVESYTLKEILDGVNKAPNTSWTWSHAMLDSDAEYGV